MRRTLATSFSGRDNAFNFMRLLFATAVIVGHARIIGYGVPRPPHDIPIDLGGLSVCGFFALSGFLITRSGRRTPFLRYWWHRILRIFPGYWVCLLITAAVVEPILWWRLHGGLAGYLSARPSPFGYLTNNWSTNVEQPLIGDTLNHAHVGDINGSLWTLKYELACYVLISLLAVFGILRRMRFVVLALALAGVAVIAYDFAYDPVHTGPLVPHQQSVAVPFAGQYFTMYLVIFSTAFLLGATAEMFKEYVPINDVLGAISLVVVGAAMVGQWVILGPALVAYVYLLLWAGIRLPSRLRRVGRRNDYSYGVYIYAFIVQQVLAFAGVTRFGLLVYLGLSLLVTYAVAMLSWHLVEKQALKLKDWTPVPLVDRLRAYRTRTSSAQHPAVIGATEPSPVLAPPPEPALPPY